MTSRGSSQHFILFPVWVCGNIDDLEDYQNWAVKLQLRASSWSNSNNEDKTRHVFKGVSLPYQYLCVCDRLVQLKHNSTDSNDNLEQQTRRGLIFSRRFRRSPTISSNFSRPPWDYVISQRGPLLNLIWLGTTTRYVNIKLSINTLLHRILHPNIHCFSDIA